MSQHTAVTTHPDQPIDNPGNWTRQQVMGSGWKTALPQDMIAELLDRADKVYRDGLVPGVFTIEEFPAPVTAHFLQGLSSELESGNGFAVLTGLDIAQMNQSQCETLFWGLGLHIGTAVPINAAGDLIGHVKDHGLSINNPDVRNYQTTEELKLHNDTCDILGLMCLRNAKSGGDSAIASATAIHNEIQQTRPDLLRALYQPYAIDRRGEKGWPEEGDSPWFALPIFSFFENLITTRYTVHEYYYESQKFNDAPILSEIQKEALEYLRTTARDPRFHFNFRLQPGDVQLLNNYCVLHARTGFEDYPEEDRRRHLLRLWLSTGGSRPLHPVFSNRYRSSEGGVIRGGIAPKD